MKKNVLSILLLLLILLGVWAVLATIDWKGLMNWDERRQNLEERLGETIWEVMSGQETVIEDEDILAPVDSLFYRLTERNDISQEGLHLHVVANSNANAFALPGGRIVLNSGIITFAENEAELAGVLAHELAHVNRDHVMDKLMREMGIAVLTSVAGGDAGGETVREVTRLLTSRAYSRQLEEEADEYAVTYMQQACFNPEDMAHFLYRLSDEYPDLPQELFWFSTHPEPKARAEAIAENITGESQDCEPVLKADEWQRLNERLGEL